MRKIFIFLILCFAVQAENPYRIYNNFNAGELTPLLNIREDLAKYQSGCSIMENMIPLPQGGAMKRPGTKYIAEVKTSSLSTRLLPFEYSTEQSYIIEVGNQYMRFYADGAQLQAVAGTEDISALDNVKGHWLLNDDLATQAVLDDDGNTHDGVTNTSNTAVLHRNGYVGTGSFKFSAADSVIITDHADFEFIEGVDGDFSLSAWIYIDDNSNFAMIMSKWDVDAPSREWIFYISSNGKLALSLIDEVDDKAASRISTADVPHGWHHVVATYEGEHTSWTGATAANYIILYIDGALAASTATNNAGYTKMVAGTSNVLISGRYSSVGGGDIELQWPRAIDDVAIFGDVLSAAEVAALVVDAAYEIDTPYLTADLFNLKFEQSADVLYITHPSYETRNLSRIGDTAWTIEAADYQTGPFRTQNNDTTKTITASATTGSVTLTASGHSPFIGDSTSGHIPNGSEDTDKAQTGALFKLVHPLATLEYSETLTDNYTNSQVENTSWMSCGTVYKGGGWSLSTLGTWTGTLEVQRNYTVGAAHGADGWESVLDYASADDRNVSTSGTELDADASYRCILTASGDAAETCKVYYTTDQTERIGIVEITAVASSTSATATVIDTLASTDATHKWAEGSWSNYRGWPQTVTFFEDRLMFGGNTGQPDTIWGSVTSDYGNMTAGVDDDEAVIFTLSSRQVNNIEWMVGKDKLLVGTSGAEWTLEGGGDEPLTPSSILAKQQSAYGSANLQAGLANDSVLFFQRGKEKMRELAYNWELDSYVAPDMTILANLVTDSGIDDLAFQKTPDSILWCVRNDGELPLFSYERQENITAWSRMVTEDGTSDSDFESVARIHGDPEDEIWVIVERTIDSSVVRYIEQFQDRDFGDDADDAYYVDCGITYDSTATTTITGLTHLEGETVSVLADGVVLASEVVASGQITIDASASTVQVGLPYEVHLRTMPLSWVAQGQTIQGRIKRISEVVTSWYESGDFSIGKTADNVQTHSISGQTTDIDRKTFPPGYDRNGYVYVYQKSPEPLTLLAVMVEFVVQ